ncbi:CmcI family methyltransferase [Pseudonocardia bannensis]|uniref:Cephalosporin hydroxylase n=1 Tax=Pseudonocardia bannensis TaxID=630973 RepID=A0A848DFP0_9PSEU|nr:CmcI family methyltransferase [Pseudonocardia bannensis]NMH91379.1 cephalosporin hydroxylase [Pseudonocardia bannensis]
MGSNAHQDVLDAFHRLYYDLRERTRENNSWLGVKIWKCPLDLWVYQELLYRVRPDLVVETGTYKGGSAYFMAGIFDLMGYGRVLTVDVDEDGDRPEHDRIEYVTGSSLDPAVLAQVREEAARNKTVLVILDSDHHCDHVLAELREYSGIVTPGSYLIVEDTNINGHPVRAEYGPGPREAVDIFLADARDFVPDAACEKFLLTWNAGGYLRRVGRPAGR